MDFDFGLDVKNQPAKSGRRARVSKPKPASNAAVKETPPTLDPTPSRDVKEAGKSTSARPSRRMGGWGDSGVKDKVEDSRLFADSRTRLESDDDANTPDIEIIPDADSELSKELADKMAAPPSIALNQVATYRELDSDLQRHSTFTLLDNEIDLKLLAKHMSSASDVRESSDVWDWDGLFTDVSSNLKSQSRQKTDIGKQDQLI